MEARRAADQAEFGGRRVTDSDWRKTERSYKRATERSMQVEGESESEKAHRGEGSSETRSQVRGVHACSTLLSGGREASVIGERV